MALTVSGKEMYLNTNSFRFFKIDLRDAGTLFLTWFVIWKGKTGHYLLDALKLISQKKVKNHWYIFEGGSVPALKELVNS